MSHLSDLNKYLKVNAGVVLTPVIDYAIHEVDQYFKTCPSTVTSGYRGPAEQLKVVQQYLKLNKLADQYPGAMFGDVNVKSWSDQQHQMIYDWQLGWSALLNAGVIINPPYAAICLLDYFGPSKTGVNRKGQVIQQTPHAAGLAFNVGGGQNGPADEAACIELAVKSGVKSIASWLMERNNNALHCNARKVL